MCLAIELLQGIDRFMNIWFLVEATFSVTKFPFITVTPFLAFNGQMQIRIIFKTLLGDRGLLLHFSGLFIKFFPCSFVASRAYSNVTKPLATFMLFIIKTI